MGNFQEVNEFINYIPVPMCTVDDEGKIVDANALIGDVFIYDGIIGGDVFALLGIKKEEIFEACHKDSELRLSRNDKIFKILPKKVGEDISSVVALYFIDLTAKETAEEKYIESKTCMAVVNIDNFDELNSSTNDENHFTVIGEIDKTIRHWAGTMEASVTRHKEHMYFVVFEYKHLREQQESKFSILDKVREIETDADFPITLSIGIGINGRNLDESDEFADQALDLALGRGGDQVVIKNKDKITYYGGKAQTVEKSNKGKSRIIGHALKRLIEASSKVFIMGHRNPDMDSFGSALGIAKLTMLLNKEAYIVVDKYNEALVSLYEEAKSKDVYNLINSKKALSMIDQDCLVVVVDTHRPSQTECPDLLKCHARSVVIDHHRKAEEFVENPTMVYTEPYASSTSELVTEILQYTIERRSITKLEAEALLAGIFVDTNRFSVKSGVRTFEAAAWLRRAGADIASVKRLFQISAESFKTRATCIAAATVEENGVAYSICEGQHVNSQIINSQVADELLTIQGVTMSFVAGQNENGRTIVSARSIGEKNVQIIMEEFNGGGHLNTAGAQMNISPEEAIEEIKKILKRDDIV
ncbi:MAG: DHH family phosphoesterase [Anaerovoracaceae bacterium]